MGAWGEGIFENDAALDELGHLIGERVEIIRQCFADDAEPDELIRRGYPEILANVDIICTLCRHYHTVPEIQTAEIEQWQEKYLNAYDTVFKAILNKSEKSEQHIATQRAIIIATFYQLLRIVDALWGE